MLSISNEFQPIPDEIKLFSLYVNRYFPKQEKEFKNCEEPQIINEKEEKKEFDMYHLLNPFIPVGMIVGSSIAISVYTAAGAATIAIGSVMYGVSIGLHIVGNLGGVTNLCRHAKYTYEYIQSSKLYFLDKELPEDHMASFVTPYVYYKIMKSINEFNHLSENNKKLIVQYVKENKNYDYQDVKHNVEIKKLYTRIFFNYNLNKSTFDSLFDCDMENIKHSTVESLFISNYMKFLIGNHISIISE